MKRDITIVANDVQCHYKDKCLKFLMRHKAYLIFVNFGGANALFSPVKVESTPKMRKFATK